MYNIFDPFSGWDNKEITPFYRKIADEINKEKFIPFKSRVTCVGVIYDDGSYNVSNNHSCHMGLMEDFKRKGSNHIRYIISSLQNSHEHMTKEEVINFVNYITNKSMYADAFLDKDAEGIFNRGYYLLDTLLPDNVVCGAAMATRFISESQNRFGAVTLKEMLKHPDKFEPNHAFAFSHIYQGHEKNTYPIYPTEGADNHNGYDISRSGVIKVKNFIYNNRIYLNPPYIKTIRYSDVDKMWGIKRDGTPIIDICNGLRPKIIHEARDYNIFRKIIKKRGNIINLHQLKDVYDQFVEKIRA